MGRTLGLTGYAGSGKDTAAQALLDSGWERRAFADAVKAGLLGVDPVVSAEDVSYVDGCSNVELVHLSEIIEAMGWDFAKRAYPEVRRLLQAYGTEGGRHVHGSDCWIKAARASMLNGVDYVFTDARFPNEVEMIHQAGGVVVRIDRTGVEAVNAHVSDDIGGLPVDLVIVNNGTVEDLHTRMLELFE